MSHEGVLELGLLQTDGQPAIAPNTPVRLHDVITHREYGTHRLSFPPEQRLQIPAFPESQVLIAEVSPERYRHRNSGFFTVTTGETVFRRLTVFRNPKKWQAQFRSYALLPVQFDGFKRVLGQSPRVRFLRGAPIGLLTDATYDGLSAPKAVLAKAALLNLYMKLRLTEDPTGAALKWFDFVEELLEVGRERLIARVAPAVVDAVKAIRDNDSDFPDYRRAPAGDHFSNYPAGFTVTRSRILSVKTREETGNLQICVAPAKDNQGQDVVLLDADIDENGKLLEHLADVFRHKFTGGTHPFDIHEFLRLQYGRGEPLGYELI